MCSSAQNLNALLLEFNSGPDLKMTGDRLDYIISDMLRHMMVDVVANGGNFPSIDPTAPQASAVQQAVAASTGSGVDVVVPDAAPGSHQGWDLVYDQTWAVSGPSLSFL